MKLNDLATNKFLRITVPGILVLLLWFLFKDKFSNMDETVNEKRCERQAAVKNQNIEGVLSSKYLDERKLRRMRIFDGRNTLDIDIFVIEGTDFYDFLQVGDSIRKELGSLDFTVKKAGQDSTHTLYYGCD